MPQIAPLTTSIIGSYASPSWLLLSVEAIKAGRLGPKDTEEVFDDAVDWALREQEEAGVDIISDGEMRRLGFFTAGFYKYLTGLRAVPPQRKFGAGGHDQREKYHADDPFKAPNGLGLVAEYAYAKSRTTRAIKVPCPGPFTLAGRILPGKHYTDRMDVAYAFADIINAELKALVAAGATFIQMDEPSYAVHSSTPEAFVKLFNKTIEGVEARIGLHLCFGNYIGRPVAHRTFKPLFPYILDIEVDEFAMEFANRELHEIELIREVTEAGKTIAAGLVDVKNYFVETPDIVADRIRAALQFAPPEQLVITPDCGLSETARWAAKPKLQAMVAGTQTIRQELGLSV